MIKPKAKFDLLDAGDDSPFSKPKTGRMSLADDLIQKNNMFSLNNADKNEHSSDESHSLDSDDGDKK